MRGRAWLLHLQPQVLLHLRSYHVWNATRAFVCSLAPLPPPPPAVCVPSCWHTCSEQHACLLFAPIRATCPVLAFQPAPPNCPAPAGQADRLWRRLRPVHRHQLQPRVWHAGPALRR